MIKRLLFCWLVLTNLMTRAQQWEPTYGPAGNTPWDIKEINGTLFLAADWGNYRSADHGAHWTKINLPSPQYGGSITSFWPIGTDIFFRNYVSHDGGSNWSQTSLSDNSIIKYVKDGSTLFALSDYTHPYYSQDDGATWNSMPDLSGRKSGMVAINSTIYVAVADQGVFYTTLQDGSWHALNSGFPVSFYLESFDTDGTNLYAGTMNGIYSLTGASGAWTNMSSAEIASTPVRRIYMTASDIYLGTDKGIYRSATGSTGWQHLPDNIGWYPTAMLVSGGTLYAGFNALGLYKTNDQGVNWSLLNNGIYAGYKTNYLCPSQGKVWEGYSYYHRMHSTADQGQNWKPVKFNYQVWWPTGMMTCLFANGTDVYYGEQNGYIYYSHDGCATTAVSDSSLKNTNYVYARKFVSVNNDVYLIYGKVLKRSTDRGISWSNVTGLPTSYDILDICSHKGFIYVATTTMGGAQTLYRSADGNNWTAQLTYQSWNGGVVASSNTLYVYEVNGVHQSSDGGNTWTMIDASALPAMEIISAAADESGLYLVPLGHGDHGAEIYYGIYLYSNGGWQTFNNGLDNLHVNCIASDGSYLYAGVDYAGVYRVALNTTNVHPDANGDAEIVLEVYPNPAEGVITVKSGSNGKVRLFDMEGKCVYASELKENTMQIDLGEKPAGVYVVELQSGERKVTRKVILE